MIFKTIPKELQSEGITLDLINTINMDTQYSPVQLNPGDEPAKLMQCSSGYWVVMEDGSVLKERNGYYVVPVKEAQIGRARYLLNFKDQIAVELERIHESKIQDEILSLKKQVDVKVSDDLDKLRQILVMAGKIEVHGLEAILIDAVKNATGDDPFSINYRNKVEYEQRVAHAKELDTENDLLSCYERLKQLSEAGEYNTLYQHYFQDGLPLLSSFNRNNPEHMTALIKSFHRDKIMATIDEIKEKDHLYMVAKFNVDKRGQ